MPKPRTNSDAIEYWADGILSSEPRPHIEVNSIKVKGDTVYSFGNHFPMGVIVRNERGRCTRVLINSDRWGQGGFANTNGDLYDVLLAARDRASKRKSIKVVEVPLTGHTREVIQCLPREDDPEPEAWYRTEVPTYFLAYDPGPEPVKDRTNCIAGRGEEYEAADWGFAYDHDIVDNALDFTVRYTGTTSSSLRKKTASNHRTVWGEEARGYDHWKWPAREPANTTYKQCPCCAKFDAIHEQWSLRYHGKPYGRGAKRGFKLYSEMMDRFGSEEGWREGRRQDWARVREGREARAAWLARNFIPVEAVSYTWAPNGVKVPHLTPDGYATRKDQVAYFARQRELDRAERRRQREQAEHDRQRARVERWKASFDRKRAKRPPSLKRRIRELNDTLAEIRDELTVTVTVNGEEVSDD